ncbi:type IV secretion system DNA-binding domain-containing protein [Patescibacteria group bacterium]|nr:type IV secretion system DNA-binding domain-containing protein [Patescibacteria group bacterium]
MNDLQKILSSVFLVIFLGLFLIILLKIIFAIIKNKYRKKIGFNRVVYRVSVDKNNNENNNNKSLKEYISSLESFFYNIGNLKPKIKLKDRLFGRTDDFSIEIINDNEDLLSFYFTSNKSDALFLKQEIINTWPNALIEEISDYNIFSPFANFSTALLNLKKPSYIPIKNYQEFESDPVDGILNSISDFIEGDGAGIQILFRSSKSSWRNDGLKIVDFMKQGNNYKNAKQKISKLNFEKINNTLDVVNGKDAEINTQIHNLSQEEEELVKGITEKASKPGFDVNIRIVVSSLNIDPKVKIQNVVNSFSALNKFGLFNSFYSNIKKKNKKIIEDFIFRKFSEKDSFVLSSSELVTIAHMPLNDSEIHNIRWLKSKRLPAPSNIPKEGFLIGYNNYRNKNTNIFINEEDRMRHMYFIGKSGTGKSALLTSLILEDLKNGNGACIMDPHGELAQNVLENLPKSRVNDVILFDPTDLERPIGLNLLEFNPEKPEEKTLVVNEMIEIFDVLYDLSQTGGPMFEQYARNAMALNLEDPESGSTILEIPRVLADPDFRRMKLSKCKNKIVKDFWEKEAQKAGGDASLANVVPYISSKLNQFLLNEYMINIISQQKSTINFNDIMNNKKILLCKFSKGSLGETATSLLGLVVVNKILLSALSRDSISRENRIPFYLYIDECQNFLTKSIQTILSESRKYNLGLVMANQFISQLTKNGRDNTIKDSIFGNSGTIGSFRVGQEDAEYLEKEFSPGFTKFDIMNSESLNCVLKTLVNNTSTKPFNLTAYKFWEKYQKISDYDIENIKHNSSISYGKNRADVENEVSKRLGLSDMNEVKEMIQNL